MKQILKKKQWFASLVTAALMVTALGNPAFASGGSGSGGGSGGSGGGSGGNGGSRLTTLSLPFDDWGDYYNGVLPQGRATFIYSADGSSKSLNVQVSSINAPDGTVMSIETQELWVTPTGTAFSLAYYPITIRQGKGTLALSTANGDNVTVLLPSAGQTNIYLITGSPPHPLMVAQIGHIN